MNQMEQARGIVARIAARGAELEHLQELLATVLGDAQNAPPHGQSDGSIDPDSYASLRSLERQLSYLGSTLSGAKKV